MKIYKYQQLGRSVLCGNPLYIALLNKFYIILMTKSQVWTTEEDKLLKELYTAAACFQRWKFISKKMKQFGIFRTQSQCRERFINKLDPSLKRGKFSLPQIAKLFQLYNEYGPKWSFFQTKIPGRYLDMLKRSQSLLKNKFYSTLRKIIRNFIKEGRRRNLGMEVGDISKIPSKLIVKVYNGKKNYASCKNILKNCLKNLGYSIDTGHIQNYLSTLAREQVAKIIEIFCSGEKIDTCIEAPLNPDLGQQEPRGKQAIEESNLEKVQQVKQQSMHDKAEEQAEMPKNIYWFQVVYANKMGNGSPLGENYSIPIIPNWWTYWGPQNEVVGPLYCYGKNSINF